MLVAVALVVSTVVLVAVSQSAAIRAAAVALVGIGAIALTVYVYALLARSGVDEDRARGPVQAPRGLPLGAGVDDDRLRSATVAALRDAHALQRGTVHFAAAAASTLRAQSGGTAASRLIELFEAQRDCAASQARRLDERLEALGQHAARGADDEAVIAASLYERLLVRGVATNARHAFGLASLAAATYLLIEHLGAVTGDDATQSLAARCRHEIDVLAERWWASWEMVLDVEHATDDDTQRTMLRLLEEGSP